MISLRVQAPQSEATTVQVCPGHHSAGGGPVDDLSFSGAPPGLFDLEVSTQTAIVIPRVAGADLRGRALKVGERRLLRPGEPLTVAGYVVVREPDTTPEGPAEGTAALARGMLGSALTGSGSSALPSLVWLNGWDCGKRLPLLDEATFLGRGEGSGCRIRDALASRTHAKLLLREGKGLITDLVSANGVEVDGTRVDGERELSGGEVIRIGETELLFELPPRPPAPPAKAAPPPAEAPVEACVPDAAPSTSAPGSAAPRPRYSPLEMLFVGVATAVGAVATAAVWAFAR